MSRIGKTPITIKDSITVTTEKGGRFGNLTVKVKGPKGELSQDMRQGINVRIEDNQVLVDRDNDLKQTKAYHGLYRSLLDNMIIGVDEGYEKNLEIHGVGYRAKLVGKNLELSLGLNHPILFETPEGIELELKDDVDIKVKGIDKTLVGETAAKIRAIRKPEPYKGKGIRYKGEHIIRKVGKTSG